MGWVDDPAYVTVISDRVVGDAANVIMLPLRSRKPAKMLDNAEILALFGTIATHHGPQISSPDRLCSIPC